MGTEAVAGPAAFRSYFQRSYLGITLVIPHKGVTLTKDLMTHDKLDKWMIGIIIFHLAMAVIVLFLGDMSLRW